MKQVVSILVCMLAWIFLSAQQVTWTWMGGDTTVNHQDTVGKPGSRSPMYTWTDKAGNFYMFGGEAATNPFFSGYQAVLTNALWKYNPSAHIWTWISGGNASMPNQDVAAVRGTPGVAAPAITPGSSRTPGASYVDQSGNFWLYGGKTGARAFGTNSDLWKFDPAIGQWTFLTGNGTDVVPSYGTKGVSSPSTYPGARTHAALWTDNRGNLYLYGGVLENAIGPYFGDVWKYDIAANSWTWVCGSQWDPHKPEDPVYGQMGVFAPENTPGSSANSYIVDMPDSIGIISLSVSGERWNYAVVTNQWAWISGNRKAPLPAAPARNYGVKGVPSDSNNPGSRSGPARWTDSMGNGWLFGGRLAVSPDQYGHDQYGYWNDLWKYTAQTHQWAWIAGDSALNRAAVYGTMGIPAEGNQPGGRTVSAVWKDAGGDIWLYGGIPKTQTECCGVIAWYNDLWKLSITNAALPVKLSSFTAQKQQQTALLKWTTAQEQNSLYFVVERSPNRTGYDSIGKVAAMGTASSSVNYFFTDKSPVPGTSYYRLKQVDRDGRILYSAVEKVVMQKEAAQFTVLRNPVQYELHLQVELSAGQDLIIRIIDLNGQEVLRKAEKGRSGVATHSFSVGHLAKGLYFVQVQSPSINGTKPFIKQ